MMRTSEDQEWTDDFDDDGYDPSPVRAVALKYYRQWRAGQLDPNEPVHVELLLAAEHLLNEIQSRAAAVLMPRTPVKLSLPGMHTASACETTGAASASALASNGDGPELP